MTFMINILPKKMTYDVPFYPSKQRYTGEMSCQKKDDDDLYALFLFLLSLFGGVNNA
jgi:hypothetical protein